MSGIQTLQTAYACCAGTITLMLVFALRNRAGGWSRQRHPNWFTIVADSEVRINSTPALRQGGVDRRAESEGRGGRAG